MKENLESLTFLLNGLIDEATVITCFVNI